VHATVLQDLESTLGSGGYRAGGPEIEEARSPKQGLFKQMLTCFAKTDINVCDNRRGINQVSTPLPTIHIDRS
jgi:hypothetical protein